jgi:anti-anti-sigma factor
LIHIRDEMISKDHELAGVVPHSLVLRLRDSYGSVALLQTTLAKEEEVRVLRFRLVGRVHAFIDHPRSSLILRDALFSIAHPPFGAWSQEKDGVATIALSGELDMATAPILSDSLARFEGNGVSTIVLDLHDLTFIDSTGLHVSLEARNRAMSNGQRLLVRGASPTAQRHVEIVGQQFLLDDPEHDSELLV